ncbi:hypothetical protein PENTCL1PPCAC_10079, partial [Pristionchus entomophagus]
SALLLLVSCALALEKTCDEQYEVLDKDHREDIDMHECRACKMIDLDANGNCPKMEYECDESLPIATNVLHAGDCGCALLRCVDPDAKLAVGGATADKVRCKNLTWIISSKSNGTSSAVCARKCGLGVCPVLPAKFFEGQDIFGPLRISRPDEDHPCAWADCQIGAVASNGVSDLIYRGISSFACSSDRTWRYTGPGAEQSQLKDVRCVIKDCEQLPQGSNDVCTNKYFCYAAEFVEGDGDDWKKMKCDYDHALRRSEDNTETAPTCKIGQWSADGNPIDRSTGVMCITCPDVKKEPLDSTQPTVSLRNKAVTCDKGELTIEYGNIGSRAPVNALTCSNDFEWETTDGQFPPYSSLGEIIRQGVPWKARCITEPPKPCKELPPYDVPLNNLCSTKYQCYTADFVDGDVPNSKIMKCDHDHPHALRLYKDLTELAPTCRNGQWTADTKPIDGNTAVTCITCPRVAMSGLDVNQPEVSPRNKEVTCLEGQLTIEYESNGPQLTEVTSLTCSGEFEWTTEGGKFDPFDSLVDAVRKGATWKARCITPPPKPCATLPNPDDAEYCYIRDVKDDKKYSCTKAAFTYTADFSEGLMQCASATKLRYAENVNTLINPECNKGQWTDNNNPIPDTTKVICIHCRDLYSVSTDTEQLAYDANPDPNMVSCPTKPLVLDLWDENTVSIKRIDVANKITCNHDTWLWEAIGTDLGVDGPLDTMIEKGWKIRCLNPGEK